MNITQTLSFEDIEVCVADNGYINATKICKARNKRIGHWLELEATKELVDNFYFDNSEEDLINLPNPVIVVKGGSGEQGSRGHGYIQI